MKISEIKELLEELGTHPKKALGQNFLVSESVVQKIVAASTEKDWDRVIEIGPGLGALTRQLQKQADKFSVIELDSKFSSHWREQGIEVIEGDALKVDWPETPSGSGVLVSNLPYQISSSIVIERSVRPFGIEKMVLMFQKEVAQRILAKPGGREFGLLSVIAQFFWNVRFLTDAGPKDFYPPPKVASRVLVFDRKVKGGEESEMFLKFVKAAFSQRRKFLWKNVSREFLSRATLGDKTMNIPQDAIKQVLEDEGFGLTVRAEELSSEDFYKVFKRVMSFE